MPLVTNPVLIDPNTFACGSLVSDGFPSENAPSNPGSGPWVWKIGSLFYALLQDSAGNTQDTGAAGMWSSPNGTTWTRLDAVHEPALGAGLSACYPILGGTLIYCVYTDGAGAVRVNSFDTGTGLWVGQSPAGPIGWTAPGGGALRIVITGGFHVWVFATSPNPYDGTKSYIQYSDLTGGVTWGPVLTLTPNTAGAYATLLGVTIDNSDTIHVLVDFQAVSPGPILLEYYQVESTAGVATGPTTIPDPAGLGDGVEHQAGPMVIMPASGGFDQIVVPISSGAAAIYATKLCALFITNLFNAVPTFTSTVIDDGLTLGASNPSDDTRYGALLAMLDALGNMWAFWVVTNFTTGSNVPEQIWMSALNLPSLKWGPAQLFYDAGNNPPGVNPVPPAQYGGDYITNLGGCAGSFLVIATMPFSVTQAFAGWALFATLGGPMLTLTFKGQKVYQQ